MTGSNDSSALRVALATAGVVVLLAAFVGATGPIHRGIEALRDVGGTDYALAAGLGAVALFLAAASFLAGRESTDQTEMPDVERPTPVPAPGDRFESRVWSWRFWAPVIGRTRREAVRSRLRALAVEAVAVEQSCTREAAERIVDRGEWTEDAVAAAYLGDGVEGPPRRRRLAVLVEGEPWSHHRVRRTVAAVAELETHGPATSRASRNGRENGPGDDRERTPQKNGGERQRGYGGEGQWNGAQEGIER